MKALFPLLIYLVFMMVFLTLSIKVGREDHRLVIFRLGRFFGVKGPGLVIRIPVVDRIQDVNLTESLPGWQGLSKPELDERVKSLVLSRPQGPG
jgi:regulator of protease activity HflC (stomatin/prohibitin superfamily)